MENKPTDFEMEEKYLHNGYDKLCFFYKLEDFKDESEIRILVSTHGNPYSYSQLHHLSNFHNLDKMLRETLPLQDSFPLKIDSAGKLIEQIVVSPHAHNQFIKTVKQSIENINVCRQLRQADLISRNIIESKRKLWV